MAACPNCHQSVEILDKHLGTLFTCPHCNAVFFVDWNGQPEMAQHEVEPHIEENFVPPADVPRAPYETSIEPTYVGTIPENVPEEMAPQAEPYMQPADEIPPGSEVETPPDYQQGHQHDFQQPDYQAAQDYQTTEEANVEEPPPYGQEENAMVPATTPAPEPEIDPYDFNQALGQPPPQPMKTMTSDNSNFSDITDFANANTSSGPLSYVVIIDGIESSHLLKQLREAMTDSRFGWDVHAILSQMAGGRLILSGLSPAKASVLINRIKYLPFKISWRQDVLSGS